VGAEDRARFGGRDKEDGSLNAEHVNLFDDGRSLTSPSGQRPYGLIGAVEEVCC
jgi:hypothetical protein